VDLTETVRSLTRASAIHAVSGGHQSRVFELLLGGGQRAVAKVLDATLSEQGVVRARVEAVAALADLDGRVCRPIQVEGQLVNVIADHDGSPALLLCFEFANGVALDVAVASDAELMGATLAGLHRSLARVAGVGIPEVAALRAVRSTVDDDSQLLHGDFNSGNLRRNGTLVKVFDFEDCGYGPRSFEIANALYMALFAATIDDELGRYRRFEQAFFTGYGIESGHDVDRYLVDQFVDLRVRALENWLADLSTAPVGIRTATPEWHATLRSFVSSYEPRRP
jgi:Ser/Thr protein kinase RdoA (MazF antagonist)